MGPVILSILIAYHSLILTMCNSTTWISRVHCLSIVEVPVTQNSVCYMIYIVEQSLYDTVAALRDSSVGLERILLLVSLHVGKLLSEFARLFL